MKVRNITAKELDLFVSLSQNPNQFKKVVQGLWQKNLSAPQSCFILEENNEIIGRVGYWFPSKDNESAVIFGLELPWENKNLLKYGEIILNDSFNYLKKQGVKVVDSQLDSSEQEKYELSKKLYKIIDMKIIQSKKRFFLNIKEYDFTEENRLNYISLKKVGKDYFIDIIRRVTKNTLDMEDLLNIKNFGEEEAALHHFESLKNIDYSPEDWQIGVLKEDVIGLIIPQVLNEDIGTINYIGVVPNKRGNSYGRDLLDRGIKNLIERDINKIIADIDSKNHPMEAALKNIGFRKEKKLLNYRISLL